LTHTVVLVNNLLGGSAIYFCGSSEYVLFQTFSGFNARTPPKRRCIFICIHMHAPIPSSAEKI